MGGLPGLRGLDHVGFTVPDLEEATRFFVEVLGCEAFYDVGPISGSDGWMEEQLGVDRDAVIKKLRFLRCGHGSNFELFEYEAPDQRRDEPRNSDIGGHHLAFYVDDFAVALQYLLDQGLEVQGKPIVRNSGPNAGLTWIYFRTPWGMQCELVSFPTGKGYENTTERRLWEPRYPAR